MKIKSALFIASVLSMAISSVQAQVPALPADYKFTSDADYARYENNVKECEAWLIKSSIDKDADKRKEISAFLVQWISGAPNVTVNIGSVYASITEQKDYKYNSEMLVAYMSGIAVFELNNPSEKDEAKIETAGVDAVLQLADSNSALLKDSEAIKKLKAMKDKGELEKWVKDTIARDSK